MARSSRRNFWDNVRRNRNAQKPDYWEEWSYQTKTAVARKTHHADASKKFYFTHEKPSASQARIRLRSLGLNGTKLSSKVRSIMKDETTMAYAELELYVYDLFVRGFTTCPPVDQKDGTIIICFEKHSPTGELEASAQITFSKPSSN